MAWGSLVINQPIDDLGADKAEQRRDALLLKLLKTPPQPRPKRERAVQGKPKPKSAKTKIPAK